MLNLTGHTAFQSGLFDALSGDHLWYQWFASQLVNAGFFAGKSSLTGCSVDITRSMETIPAQFITVRGANTVALRVCVGNRRVNRMEVLIHYGIWLALRRLRQGRFA